MFDFKKEFDLIEQDNMTLKIIETYEGDDTILPFYYWGIYVNGVYAGKISLRIGNNFHTKYNGNIGYEIFTEHQGHHYALTACRLVLKVAAAHNMNELILTCSENNVPSYKTIEHLGGELTEITEVPKEYFAWHMGMKRERIYKLYLNQDENATGKGIKPNE